MQTTKANLSVSSVPSQTSCEQVQEQEEYLMTVDNAEWWTIASELQPCSQRLCKIIFIHILPMVIYDLLC